MADPTGLIFVGAGGWLLGKLLEPAVRDLGEELRDQLTGFLGANRRRVLDKAAEQLTASKEPRAVPLRVLLPLLERSGYEDGDFLQDRWAALLATAATASEAQEVPPAFAQILAQLTPECAAVLELLSRLERRDRHTERRWGFTAADLAARLQSEELQWVGRALTEADILFAFDLASGAGLIERELALLDIGDGVMVPTDGRDVHLSLLGRRFVAACTPRDRSVQG